jgi:hypothetical protein
MNRPWTPKRFFCTLGWCLLMAIGVCVFLFLVIYSSGCSNSPPEFILSDVENDGSEFENIDTESDPDELEQLDTGTGSDELEQVDTGTGSDELEQLDTGTGSDELEQLDTGTGSDELPDSGADPCELRIAELEVCGECFHCDRCRDGSGICERDGLGHLASLPDCNDKPIFCPLSKRDLRDGCSCVLCCGE